MSSRNIVVQCCIAGLVIAAFVLSGCSENKNGSGLAQADGNGLEFNDTSVGTEPRTVSDAGDFDSQIVAAGCRSDQECKQAVTNLSPCEDVQCMDNGDCATFPVADCCETDDDCPAIDDECIESFCPEPGTACTTRSVCKLCEVHADCIAVAEACEVGWCAEGGRCEFKQLEICCVQDNDCLLMDACIESQCFDGRCLYNAIEEGECCTTKPVYLVGDSEDMEFVASSDNPTIFWHVIETDLTPSPPYALYVGNSETMSTATIGDVNAVAVFDLGNLLEGAQLDFRAHAFVNLAKTGTQLFQVVLTGEGVADTILYDSKAKKFDDWHLIHSNVTVAKESYYSLVMRYYQKGSIIGAELGVLIDNLEIRKDCSPFFECFDDSECDDGNPCTDDICNVGIGTASCMNTPTLPLEGVDEVCGDGLDNDCNPDTFCVSINAGNESIPVQPVAKNVNPATFYKAASSTGTDYAASDSLNLLVSENADKETAIHIILDKPEDGDGGNLTLQLTGAKGLDIVVYDDVPEDGSDSYIFDTNTGAGTLSWAWGACCVDGTVLAPLSVNQCILLEPKASDGIANIRVWQDASSQKTLPMVPVELCGTL